MSGLEPDKDISIRFTGLKQGEKFDEELVEDAGHCIAIGSRRGAIVRFVIDALRDRSQKPELKIAPSLDEMLKAHHAGASVRPVRPADLLNRDVVKLDLARIEHCLKGKVVLVTAAGAARGSSRSASETYWGVPARSWKSSRSRSPRAAR